MTTYGVKINGGTTLIAERTEFQEGKPVFRWIRSTYDNVIGRLSPDTSVSSYGDVTIDHIATLADLTAKVNACKTPEELLRERITSKVEKLLLDVGDGRRFNPIHFCLTVQALHLDAHALATMKLNELTAYLNKFKG